MKPTDPDILLLNVRHRPDDDFTKGLFLGVLISTIVWAACAALFFMSL
jgi:hypothetical protein